MQTVLSLCYWEDEIMPVGFTERSLSYSVVYILPPYLLQTDKANQERIYGSYPLFSYLRLLFLKFLPCCSPALPLVLPKGYYCGVLVCNYCSTSFCTEIKPHWGLVSFLFFFWSLLLNRGYVSLLPYFWKLQCGQSCCQALRTKLSLHSFFPSLPCPFLEAELAASLICTFFSVHTSQE